MTDRKFDEINDEDLFVKYRDNADENAFYTLYNRYSGKVLAYCIRANPDRDTAYDVFQKTWTAIIEKKKSFKGGSFIAWLMIITRNFCLMEKRNTKRFDELNDNLTANHVETFTNDMIEILANEIKKLPDDYKDIINYRYLDGFSYNELAEILNISVQTVKVRLFRAKKILSEKLSFLSEDLR